MLPDLVEELLPYRVNDDKYCGYTVHISNIASVADGIPSFRNGCTQHLGHTLEVLKSRRIMQDAAEAKEAH